MMKEEEKYQRKRLKKKMKYFNEAVKDEVKHFLQKESKIEADKLTWEDVKSFLMKTPEYSDLNNEEAAIKVFKRHIQKYYSIEEDKQHMEKQSEDEDDKEEGEITNTESNETEDARNSYKRRREEGSRND